jgi:hypothetical protein
MDATGRNSNNKRDAVGNFACGNLDCPAPFVVGEFIRFAGKSVDSDAVYAAVQLEANNPAETVFVDCAIGMKRNKDNRIDAI